MGIIGLAFLISSLVFWTTQNDQIFQPAAELQTTPARTGLQAEEVHIHSGSGSEAGEMFAWWIPAGGTGAPTMLYLHGNDKNVGHVRDMEYARGMHGLGYNVLMIDYRGYGKSSGIKPGERTVYEDAESAWDYLVQQRGIAPGRIFIYGHSLGGAVAIDLAIRHAEAAGVIEESSFTSMPAIASVTGYGFMPTDILVHERFDSLSKVSRLKIPLLVIHGTWDTVVPYQMGQQLYDAAPSPKKIELIAGGGHENSCIVGRVECIRAFTAFVSQNMH
ncbi:MAG: alpha/beta fold hydrolase [Sideroxydans sp.]|nr:alpha/beta fold hydrolase [Sideroxydans sp.]